MMDFENEKNITIFTHPLIQHKISILRDEEVDNYIAIIVQKSNPKLDDILRDFDEFIGFFGTKPE